MAIEPGGRQLRDTFFDALGELLSQEEIRSLQRKLAAGNQCAQEQNEGLSMWAFLEALLGHYGSNVGRGLAVRAGRVALKYGLQSLERLEEMKALSFRLQPMRLKMKRSLDIFAEVLSPLMVEPVTIVEEQERFLWQQRPAEGYAAGQTAWILGFIQEGLYWLSNGKYYPIEEVNEEQAAGVIYTLVIPKKALE